MTDWVLVSGDFALTGGQDRANYELAWHLAERRGERVLALAHHTDATLAEHPRVTVWPVPRPGGKHQLGAAALWRYGVRASRRYPAARVVVNGGNSGGPDINWVHMVLAAARPVATAAPLAFRLKQRATFAAGRVQERVAIRRAGLVIANSARTARDLIGHGLAAADRVVVVPLGTDPAVFTAADPDRQAACRQTLGLPPGPLVGFVGAIGYDANKGLDTLLAALARLPGVRLVAAGGGRLDYWADRARAAGVAERVTFLGHISRVADLMAGVDVLASPTRYDSYGLAVHEAVCLGTPAVVAATAGVSEAYPESLRALVLPDPEDAAGLAERIAAVLADPNGWRAKVAVAGSALGRWSWTDMAEAFVRVAQARPRR